MKKIVDTPPSQLSQGSALIVEPLSLEGMLGFTGDTRTGKILHRWQIRKGVRVKISKAEYDKLLKAKR